MPRKDGNGPWGTGVMTGRGLGPCADGNAVRRGAGPRCRRGFDRGYGRGFGAAGEYSPEAQKALLREQREALQSRLAEIDAQLEE